MTAQSGYVPPAYVPLGQSDTEPEVVQPKEERYVPRHVGDDGLALWSSGICACCDDMPSCLIGCLCPCYLFGKNAEFLGSGTLIGSCMTHFILWSVVNTVCCCISDGILLGIPGCFVACYACSYRKGLREKYKLEEAPCNDFVTHFFCHLCANCQEYREIRERSSNSNPHHLSEAVEVSAPVAQVMEADSTE